MALARTDPLDRYRAKRDFRTTPEPKASRGRTSSRTARQAPIFVVQRHAARSLHYDFRLEHDGVLLSWAVPKGPSTSVGVRRLAVRTEDHPLAYADFSGDIPAGQYGAGHVDLWDRGTWTPEGDVAAALANGHLKFTLTGKRLTGRFVLVRLKAAPDERAEQWLLIRERDVAPAPRRGHNGAHALPATLVPQLATLASAPPQASGWRYEIKFDGYRLLARIAEGDVRLYTRNGLDWTARFPTLAAGLARLRVASAWLDGEAIALDAHARSSFGALQKSLERGQHEAVRYAVFDLLFAEGEDLRALPLDERQKRLAKLVGRRPPPALVLSRGLAGAADELLAQACRQGLEGLIAKRGDAPYRGVRSRDWLKLKCRPRDEFVVGGYTAPQGSRTGLGALLLGSYESGRLVYRGRVGTGFDEATLRALTRQLAPLRQAHSPFAELPREALRKPGTPHWVEPRLVAEIEYAELTPQGLIRQGSYVGLREDRKPRSVSLPTATAASGDATVAGVAISNPSRPIPGHPGVTKLDLVRYYETMAPWLLREIGPRPLTLVRCPGGDFAHCFFQRHPDSGKGKDATIPYVRVRTLAELVASVQGGTIEFHEWGATLPRVDRPDRITLDLDPDPALPWPRFREACELTRALLDELELTWFVKTTGGKGLHFVLPIVRREGWDDAKAFARAIATHLERTLPSLFVAGVSKAKRSGRVFVDYLRNGETATAVAAYSLRARAGLPVAMPVAWEELEHDVRGAHFNVRNVPELVAGRIDPWADYAKAAQSIAKARRRLAG